PTAELVYKLVAREGADGQMVDVAKASASKATVGGFKTAGRVFENGVAQEELVLGCDDEAEGTRLLEDHGARPLQLSLVRGGAVAEEHRGPGAVRAATERHLASRAALPYEGWRLSAGDPAVPTRHIAG